MEMPPPEPAKLLAFWEEWERGETPPGRTLANLKTHGQIDIVLLLITVALMATARYWGT